MLNAHWARWKAILSLITDVRYTVLIRFPIIAQRSKGAHYFHRVVGLVVLSMSVKPTAHF